MSIELYGIVSIISIVFLILVLLAFAFAGRTRKPEPSIFSDRYKMHYRPVKEDVCSNKENSFGPMSSCESDVKAYLGLPEKKLSC
jgi:hypothetical protein